MENHNKRFTDDVLNILNGSYDEARKMQLTCVCPEHIMLSMLHLRSCKAVQLLKQLNITMIDLRQRIYKAMGFTPQKNHEELIEEDIKPTELCDQVLRISVLETEQFSTEKIDSEHVLLALLRVEDTHIKNILNEIGVTYKGVKQLITGANKNDNTISDFFGSEEDDEPMREEENEKQQVKEPLRVVPNGNSATPLLDAFGTDLTKAAEEKRLDAVVGRAKEIERMAQILARRKKNNPILIGEPGVGKSAVVEGLALRIAEKNVSPVLYGKRVVALDLASLVAGTKYRGQFEERIKAILNELTRNPQIILFIDEIHTLVGAGGATGSLDAANILKPALAMGTIQCIGATTLSEYRQFIEKDGALERRFQRVIVDPTSVAESIEILNNIKQSYEKHHFVSYTPKAIEACVKLTNRYMPDRNLPDKAIDAMDEAGASMHIKNCVVPQCITDKEILIEDLKKQKQQAVKKQNYELAASLRDQARGLESELEADRERWMKESAAESVVIDEDKIAEVVAMMTGIPVSRIAQNESEKLLNMGEDLKKAIIGQDDAIEKIVKCIQRNRAGLKDPNKPIGSFIFLGPTGVGKTHLAKQISELLFGKEDALIRIDMSEYSEKFTVSRLVGAPPGYVGYEEGGQLTEKVRRKPYSVVLLDEIEKAHPDLFNILLQVLDEGRLTDSLGRRVDFKNTIIIMTSNIGQRELKDVGMGVGFSQQGRDVQRNIDSIIEKALNKAFAPEFLNRIDDVILFKALKKEDIRKIVDIEVGKLLRRAGDLGYSVSMTDAACDLLAEKSYNEAYGARPMKRQIQHEVEDRLAEMVLKARLSDVKSIVVDVEETVDNNGKPQKNIVCKLQ